MSVLFAINLTTNHTHFGPHHKYRLRNEIGILYR